MSEPNTSQQWTIFSSLYDAVKEKERERVEKELKKISLAKCLQCGRATPYRLRSLDITAVRCRRCGTSILV